MLKVLIRAIFTFLSALVGCCWSPPSPKTPKDQKAEELFVLGLSGDDRCQDGDKIPSNWADAIFRIVQVGKDLSGGSSQAQ